MKYPKCPFIYDHNDQKEIFGCKYEEHTEDDFMTKLSVIADVNTMTLLEDLLLNEACECEKKIFFICNQEIKGFRKRLWMNFHIATYSIEGYKYLDRQMEGIIRWIILNIKGTVNIIYDNELIVRGIETTSVNPEQKQKTEKDTFKNKYTRNIEYRKSVRRINEMNDDKWERGITKMGEKQRIENEFMNEMKMMRMRNEYQFSISKEVKKDLIKSRDMRFEKEGLSIIDQTMKIYIANTTTVFGPKSFGAIDIIPTKSNKLEFISIMRYNNKMIFTFHNINLK
jgi:hypothetical protein